MVLDTILDNIANYVFGSYILLGLAILFCFVYIGIINRIDKNAMLILASPLVLALGQFGLISSVLSVAIFIGIFIYWGVMFKMILGKRN